MRKFQPRLDRQGGGFIGEEGEEAGAPRRLADAPDAMGLEMGDALRGERGSIITALDACVERAGDAVIGGEGFGEGGKVHVTPVETQLRGQVFQLCHSVCRRWRQAGKGGAFFLSVQARLPAWLDEQPGPLWRQLDGVDFGGRRGTARLLSKIEDGPGMVEAGNANSGAYAAPGPVGGLASGPGDVCQVTPQSGDNQGELGPRSPSLMGRGGVGDAQNVRRGGWAGVGVQPFEDLLHSAGVLPFGRP